MAAALACSMAANAQFVAETTDGQQVELSGKDISFATGETDGEWTLGGMSISEISSISIKPLAERLDEYTAPTYADYYRETSGWDQRDTWNLANVHDPTVVKAEDGYYYMYTTDASFGNAHTGHGHFMCRRSRNLVDWEFLGATMQSLPDWVQPKLNEIRAEMGLGESTADFTDETQFGFWAPCVRRVEDGLYRMYYAITCPGTIDGDGTWSERAFIGLMETATPWDIDSWEDKGYVITNASDKGLDYNMSNTDYANCYFKWNAIDPSYIITDEGEHWLIYGSWHSGFAAVMLDAETGKPLEELGLPWGDDITAYGILVNTREMGNRWQGSEAPEVVYRDGYYYLFMAYDELSVAYNTRVVRSTSIDGPYYDINGTNVSEIGGDAYPIVTHPYKFSQDYGWVGVSHCCVFDDGQGNWFFSSQGRLPDDAYDDAYSNAIMMGQVRRIVWTEDGWPLVLPERYAAVPQAAISEAELVGQWEDITLSYDYGVQDDSKAITLTANHTVLGAPYDGETWSFDEASSTLTVGQTKLYLVREADWENSPRRATIVYAGLDSSNATHWGKKSPSQMTHGAEDNSAGWWEAFTPYVTSTSGEATFHYSFVNYSDCAYNWDNWLLVVTNGLERSESGYTEYLVLRADNYGWGTYYDSNGLSCDYNWDTFLTDMNGASIDLTVSINDGNLDVKAVTTTESGTVYNYSYSTTGLPSGSKGTFLTMEKAHLVLDTDNCGIVE